MSLGWACRSKSLQKSSKLVRPSQPGATFSEKLPAYLGSCGPPFSDKAAERAWTETYTKRDKDASVTLLISHSSESVPSCFRLDERTVSSTQAGGPLDIELRPRTLRTVGVVQPVSPNRAPPSSPFATIFAARPLQGSCPSLQFGWVSAEQADLLAPYKRQRH